MPRPHFTLRSLLVALLPLSGCVPSEQPLLSEKESIADGELLGTWRYEDDDPRDSFVIRKKPGSETVLEAVDDEEHVDLLLTKIGDERYRCVRYADDPVLYFILRYKLQGDTLRLYELDEGTIHDAISNAELSGKAWWLLEKRAKINAAPAEIREYLEKQGKSCFEPYSSLVLERIETHDD